jgi:hypothetical protein
VLEDLFEGEGINAQHLDAWKAAKALDGAT